MPFNADEFNLKTKPFAKLSPDERAFREMEARNEINRILSRAGKGADSAYLLELALGIAEAAKANGDK